MAGSDLARRVQQPDLIVAEQFSGMDLSASDYHFLPRNKPRKMSDIKRQVQQMVKKQVDSRGSS